MQNGWSLGTIEQNGDAGRTMAYGDNDANLVSKVRANPATLGVDTQIFEKILLGDFHL